MNIIYSPGTNVFHLTNETISYIMQVLPDGELLQIYYGARIPHKDDFSYSILTDDRPLSLYSKENNHRYAMQLMKREYPDYGNGDFRLPAFELAQSNGSHISCFKYQSHRILEGKPALNGLPATYVTQKTDAQTLEITLHDPLLAVDLVLSYSIIGNLPAIMRNTKFVNHSKNAYQLTKAMSLNFDMGDGNFDMISLAGVWAREREIVRAPLRQGVQGVYSNRGTSSSEHNPFIALARHNCDEHQGECYGFTLVYSGNHVEQVEIDTQKQCRVSVGINPDQFSWKLVDEFQTPEAIIVYSACGLNGMSQTFHQLFTEHLTRGEWNAKPRPVLLNNWEATAMNFTQDQIVDMATQGKELGVELFVLDDGWFGGRDNDKRGLGDWFVTDFKKLPSGIQGLSKKIKALDMDFGLWFEPEMVNEDSALYRKHPEFVLAVPNREMSLGRNQYVLDFSNPNAVAYVFDMMDTILTNAEISYIKWDMNRYITQCFSGYYPADQQGEIFHRYILGVYALYEKLIQKYPDVLFESCASGGSRFDAGMLYYAPQAWASDDTDAIERTKIQYGTSMLYPTSSIGAHVSVVPNHHSHRVTPFLTRNHVAMFGAFGYELDLRTLTQDEKTMVKEQISFFKEHRTLFQYGTFYRLLSPFTEHAMSWMSVSPDQSESMVLYCQILAQANVLCPFLKLKGLSPEKMYSVTEFSQVFSGQELMQIGIPIHANMGAQSLPDFTSKLFYVKEIAQDGMH